MTLPRPLAIALPVAVVAALVVGYATLRAPRATKVKVGQAAPDVNVPRTPLRVGDFQGRCALVVVFHARCTHCDSYVAGLEWLNRRYLRQGLVVLAVATDRVPSDLDDLLRRYHVTFPVYRDPDGEAWRAAYGQPQPPEGYLADPAGTVRRVYPGYVNWRGSDVRAEIEACLKRTTPTVPPLS